MYSFDFFCPLLNKDNSIETFSILHCLVLLNSVLFKPCFSACYQFRADCSYSPLTPHPFFFLSRTEEPAKVGTCARDRRAPLQQFALNVHVKHSEVERSLMVRWVVGSILHGVDPLSYFSFQPVLHDWCNKGRGMCYPVCGMVHIKEPLLLIDKSSLCGGSGFPFSLSEWSFTICLTPYNRW